MESANWQQELLDCIMELQRRLEDSKANIGDNEEVNKVEEIAFNITLPSSAAME